jgi:hypothetical protein
MDPLGTKAGHRMRGDHRRGPGPRPLAAIGAARAIPEPQDPRDAPLEGVVLDAVAVGKAARDEMFRRRPMRATVNSG